MDDDNGEVVGGGSIADSEDENEGKTRSISDTQANLMMVTSRKMTMMEKAY